MAESNLSFAKVVANPNAISWSQAYNAGKLFAVLSLETKEEITEKDYLNVLGKEIFNTLEQEFFTLETKDLESIRAAVLTTAKKVPAEINCSFTICSIVENILYIYILGNGKVVLKREDKLGTLLEANNQESHSLKDASGFLQDADIIVLQTKQFSDIISVNTLSEFLDNLPPSEAAENLAPIVHEKEEAGAACIIIGYKAPLQEETAKTMPVEEIIQEEVPEPKENLKENDESPFYVSPIKKNENLLTKVKAIFLSFAANRKMLNNISLSHPKKIILTIIAIILVVFVLSIGFAVNKQQGVKTQTIFNSIYPQAQKKYNEGQGLLSLNQNLARDSFKQAQVILESGKNKLPKNSNEEKQVLELLTKVNSALGSSTGITTTKAKQVDNSVSNLLAAEIKNQGIYFTKDNKNLYGLTANEIYSLKTDGSDKKTIIKNESFWQQPEGLATYFGNVYVLDKKQNQILKFVQTDSDYSKTNYFGSANPDFSKAVSLAIDSDVYVLSTNGVISKFTKGTTQDFSLSGLENPLNNPTAVFTNTDTDNLYVLDNGNSRVVVFTKTGAYKNQYQVDVIKSAKDFEVLEKDKKIYVLSSNKIYEIDLK